MGISRAAARRANFQSADPKAFGRLLSKDMTKVAPAPSGRCSIER